MPLFLPGVKDLREHRFIFCGDQSVKKRFGDVSFEFVAGLKQLDCFNADQSRYKPTAYAGGSASAISTALIRAAALFTVSSNSELGTESATIPPRLGS